MWRQLNNKAGMGMVAGVATILVACFGITNTASSYVFSPDNDKKAALLTIQGQGVTPLAKISLSTGPQQTITTTADKNGQFVFSNLRYLSFSDLNFAIDIPPFKNGLTKDYAPTHLNFNYNTKESLVSLSGQIGKSGTVAFNLGGAESAIVQPAGPTGYVTIQTRTSEEMVSGQSTMSASIINTAEICCPKMILPSSPVTLTIVSQPVAMMAPPVPLQPPQPALQVPAVNIPVIPAPQQTAPIENTVTPPAPQQMKTPAPVPYINLPKKDGEEQTPKPKVPYIVQGRIDVDMPLIVSDDVIAASSHPYVNGLEKVSTDMRNAVLETIAAMGGFLDGRDLMNATRSLQLSTVNTLKNYTPSDQICRFGTLTRSVAAGSVATEKNQLAFSKILLDRNTQKTGTLYADPGTGVSLVLNDFRDKYCDRRDNNSFLDKFCGTTSATADKLLNRDVNFSRVFDVPLTLDADFADGNTSNDKSAIISLFSNLSYVPPLMSSDTEQWDPRNNSLTTQDLRALTALKSVTANSFAALVGQKAKSVDGGIYMVEMLEELGLSSGDANKLLGANPSYFAQMEMLTKKLFQSPKFYANLYESEANIDRQRVAMKAVELQQDRDFLESLRRREMLLSVLLNARINDAASKANESGVVTKTSGK